MKIWNPKTREYKEYKVPENWKVKYYSDDMDEEVNCAKCGKKMLFGDGYTSHNIQTDLLAFGYIICEDCNNEENLHWIYNEIRDDLFKHCEQEGRYAVHCISADYVMGGGIAVPMAKKFGLRSAFKKISDMLELGKAYLIGNSFSLITKVNVYDKPTYDYLFDALNDLKNQCEKFGIDKLVMPKIGCGIDGLDWNKVKEMIAKVFSQMKIDILVCII